MVSIDTARAILGLNFHGIEDVQQYLGFTHTPEQLQQLTAIPFPEETLCDCRDTHLLFPGYPLTLQELRNRHPNLFIGGKERSLYEDCLFFSIERLTPRWHLLQKTPDPCSLY